MNGTECRPQAPVAEAGPVGFFDGGNRRDWFPGGAGEVRAASGRLKSDVKLFNAFVLGTNYRLTHIRDFIYDERPLNLKSAGPIWSSS
jgi:hypothetical protein